MKIPSDLAARAWHTFWQTFVAVFAGAYVASGLDVSKIVDLDSAKRFLLAVGAAVLASALSAAKTTIVAMLSASKSPGA